MGRAVFEAVPITGTLALHRREIAVILTRLKTEIALEWEAALERAADRLDEIAPLADRIGWYAVAGRLAEIEAALQADALVLTRLASNRAVALRREMVAAAGRHTAAITLGIGMRLAQPPPAAFNPILSRPPAFQILPPSVPRQPSAAPVRQAVAELRRVIEARGPSGEPAVARDLFTAAQADAMASYNDAAREIYRQNGIQRVIWVSARNRRTCLACLALDGKRFPVNDLPRPHPRCRCTTLPDTPAVSRIYNDTGADWLRAQPESIQRAVMGGANFEAWRAGAVSLDDFIGAGASPALGSFVVQQSLVGILGDAAREFYRKSAPPT